MHLTPATYTSPMPDQRLNDSHHPEFLQSNRNICTLNPLSHLQKHPTFWKFICLCITYSNRLLLFDNIKSGQIIHLSRVLQPKYHLFTIAWQCPTANSPWFSGRQQMQTNFQRVVSYMWIDSLNRQDFVCGDSQVFLSWSLNAVCWCVWHVWSVLQSKVQRNILFKEETGLTVHL